MRPFALALTLVVSQIANTDRNERDCDRRSARERDACVKTEMDSAAARLYHSIGQVLEHLPDDARRTFLNDQDRWTRQQFAQCRDKLRLSSGSDLRPCRR